MRSAAALFATWRMRCGKSAVASSKRAIWARRTPVRVGRRQMAHQPDDLDRRRGKLESPHRPMPGVQLQVHPDAFGDRLVRRRRGRDRPPRSRDLPAGARPHDEDAHARKLGRSGAPRRPSRRRAPPRPRRGCAAHVERAVAVSSALTTAQSSVVVERLAQAATFRRTAPRSIVISERCTSAFLSGERSGQRVEEIARDHAGVERRLDRRPVMGRRAGRRCDPWLHPLGQERADHAGEHIAGTRRGEAWMPPSTSTPVASAAISVSGPLQQDDAAEAVDSPPNRLEPVRVDPRRLLFDQAPELAGVRREHPSVRASRRARAPRARLRRRRRAARPRRAHGGRRLLSRRCARALARRRARRPWRRARGQARRRPQSAARRRRREAGA